MGLTLIFSDLQVLLSHLWEKEKKRGDGGEEKKRREGGKKGIEKERKEGKRNKERSEARKEVIFTVMKTKE